MAYFALSELVFQRWPISSVDCELILSSADLKVRSICHIILEQKNAIFDARFRMTSLSRVYTHHDIHSGEKQTFDPDPNGAPKRPTKPNRISRIQRDHPTANAAGHGVASRDRRTGENIKSFTVWQPLFVSWMNNCWNIRHRIQARGWRLSRQTTNEKRQTLKPWRSGEEHVESSYLETLAARWSRDIVLRCQRCRCIVFPEALWCLQRASSDFYAACMFPIFDSELRLHSRLGVS